MEIRAIRPEEHETAAEPLVCAYRVALGAELDDYYEGQLRDIAGRAKVAEVFVAVRDGRVIGQVTYIDGPESPLAEELRTGEASMRMLAVDPERQGRGVGRALVVACIERAAAAGREGMFIYSTRHMSAAHRLYEDLGFVRQPERDWKIYSGETLLGFRLDLAKVG